MEVNFRPETESRLQELAPRTGRAPDGLIEDAIAGYLKELGGTREMLDSRCDDLKNGRVTQSTVRLPSPASEARVRNAALALS